MLPVQVEFEVQLVPHAPQLAGSTTVFLHVPLQSVWPAEQTQAPLEQNLPPLQVVPQAPQLVLLELVSTQTELHRA